MSTILEALRDAARARGADAPDPLDPDLAAPASAAGAPTGASRRWIAPLLAAVALAAALGWAWWAGRAPAPAVSSTATPVAAAPPSATPVAPPPATATAPPIARSNQAPTATPVPPPPAVAPRQLVAPGPVVASRPLAAAAPAKAGPPPVERPPPADALPLALRSALPPLRIGARIEGRGRSPQVLIVDGRAYHEGQALADGLSLVTVADDHAVFEIRGRRFSVGY